MIKVIRVFLTSLIVIVGILAPAGCKKKSASFDWSARPASCAHEIKPFGLWVTGVTVYVDYTQIYNSTSSEVPEYALTWWQEDMPPVLEAWRIYCQELGVPFSVTTSKSAANVAVMAYWGPWRTTSAAEQYLAGGPISDLLELIDLHDTKAPAAISYAMQPPDADLNYNGLCRAVVKSGTICGGAIWLNVYPADHFHRYDNRNLWRQYLTGVSNHEHTHARCGLRDDYVTVDPKGIMHGLAMLAWPDTHEEELIRWLYPDVKAASKVTKGLDCGGE